MRTVSDILANYLVQLRYQDLPETVTRGAKLLILDTLGVAWAGATAPGCSEILSLALDAGGAPQSTLWSIGARISAPEAAFVNGAFAAALDYDSLHHAAVVHPEIVTLPAAWALAERHHRSGRDLLTATIAGGDLTCRLALSTIRDGPWFVTSTAGTFGAAVAAGVVLRADAPAMRHAIGLSLCQTGGTIQAIREQTLAKRLQSAFAARNGVYAAQLAMAGISGPAEAFEGEGGYYAAFDRGDPEILIDQLGLRFETLNTSQKKYPSCACNHAAIEATRQIMSTHGLGPQDVHSARVRITPYMHKIVGAPFDPAGDAQVAAQFSVQYSVACAVRRGTVGLDDLSSESAREPAIIDFARRIDVEIDNGAIGFLAPATVSLQTDRGWFEVTLNAAPGSVDAPLTDKQIIDKFENCVRRGPRPLSRIQSDYLIERILNLDAVEDVSKLLGPFQGMASAVA